MSLFLRPIRRDLSISSYTKNLGGQIRCIMGNVEVANYWLSNLVRVYLGVTTCELFLCFASFVFLSSFVLTSLFPLFYVTRESNRFLHRG